jgi:predicted ATPase/class 3 adenylate cyclase
MAVVRALSPVLVGRERELTELEDALLAAARGEGRVVLLAGDAGMGKTRLATELGQRARGMGIAVLSGGCSEAELSLPYLPFLEALGNYVGRADLPELREKLGPSAGELGNLFPRLERGLVDLSDPTQAKLRLFEAMLHLLELVAGNKGLLLVLEDLHWADASTRELLDYVARRLLSSRVLVLGTYRRDEMHRKHPLLPTLQGWKRSGLAQTVELEPLGAEGVGQMVEAIFDDPARADTRDFLHGRSEGNPFVLEELLKEALDRGDIYRTDRGWQRKELSEFRLPETVRDTILLRLERLTEPQVELLRAAAVLGQTFEDGTLLALVAGEEAAVQPALEALIQQQLLERQSGRRYRFRHALTREAIYEDLITTHRERLHLRAAEVLEALQARPLDVAQHLFLAAEPERAVPVALKGAEELEAAYAFPEAADLYQRALPAVREPVERARLLVRLGRSLGRAESHDQAERYLREAIEVFEATGESAEAARGRVHLAYVLRFQGRADLAIEELERATEVLEALGPSEELAMAYSGRAFHLIVGSGDRRLAAELAEKGLAMAAAAGGTIARLRAANALGLALMTLENGDDSEALDLLLRTGTEAASLGLVQQAGASLGNYALFVPPERLPEAVSATQTLRRLAPNHERTLNAEAILGARMGRPDMARAAAERMLAMALGPLMTYTAHNILAIALIMQGDLAAARRALPPEDPSLDLQERLARDVAAMLLAWAEGDKDRFIDLSVSVIAHAGRFRSAVWVGAVVLDGAQGIEVETILASLPRGTSMATLRRCLQGQAATARGDFMAAIGLLEPVAELEAKVGEANISASARLALAEARAGLGDSEGAERELETLRESAIRRGHWVDQELVRRTAAKLGLELADSIATEQAMTPSEPSAAGERFVTVLFADVRGYTVITQQARPAELADKLAAFHRWAAQEVARHHGVVDKFAGDSVMATFNVSGTTVDHAEHALQAAVAMRDRARYLGLPLGVGIATGPAIVGRTTEAANLSVLGETTNLASRLQGQAGPGEVMLSEEAWRRLRDQVGATPEDLELKGFERPVTAYRVGEP